METPEQFSQLTMFIIELLGGRDCVPQWLLDVASYEELAYSAIALIPSFFIWAAKYYAKDRRKYSGLWNFHIYWDDTWASKELGISNPKEVHSEGTVILTYCDNTRATDYKGRGYFELKNAGQVFGFLVVELTDAVLSRSPQKLFKHELKEVKAYTRRRFKVNSSDETGNSYTLDEGSKLLYKMSFDTTSAAQLKGTMYHYLGTGNKKIQVGTIEASCEG